MTEEELIMWDDLMGVNMTEEEKQAMLLEEAEDEAMHIYYNVWTDEDRANARSKK